MARKESLPHVALALVTGDNEETTKRRKVDGRNDDEEEDEEGRKLRILPTFLVGIEGEGKGMPQDVFRAVLNMIMPSWDPLRHGVVGEGGEAGSHWDERRQAE